MAVTVDIRLRQKGGEDVSKAVKRLQTDFNNTGKAIDKSVIRARGMKDELRGIDRALDTIDTATFKRMDEDIDKARQSADKATQSIKKLNNEIERPASFADRSRALQRVSGDTAGDASTAIGGVASAASSLGIKGAGNVAAAGDLIALGEELPRLAAGLSAMSPAIIGLTAAVGAGAAIFIATKKAAESATKPIDNFVNRMPEVGRVTVDLFEVFRSGTSESIEAIRQEAGLREQLLRIQRDQLQQLVDQSNQGLEDRFGDVGAGALKLLGFNANTARDRVEELNLQLSEQSALIENLNSEYVQNRVVANDQINALREASAAQTEINRLIATGTTEQLRQRQQIIQIDRAAAQSELDSLEKEIVQAAIKANEAWGASAITFDESVDTFEEFQSRMAEGLGELGINAEAFRRLNPGEDIAAFLTEIERLSFISTEGAGGFEVFRDRFIEVNGDVEEFNQQLTALTNTAAPAIAAREREIRVIQESVDVLDERITALDKLESAESSLNELLESRANADSIKAQEQAMKDQQAAELALLDTRITAAEAVAKQRQTQEKLASLETERIDKTRELLAKARDAEVERQGEFSKELERFSRDVAIQARRIFRDANDEIEEAVADNDVVSFINAVKGRDRQLADLQEDSSIAAADKIRDFNDESLRLAKDRETQLQQIQTQFHQQRLQIITSVDGQELTALQRLQQQRAALVTRHAQQLEQFRATIEQQSFNNRVATIRAQVEALRAEYARLDQMAFNAATAVVSRAGNIAIQSIRSSIPRIGFAGGGIIDKPTLALRGERPGWGDIEIPFRKSEGVEAALARYGGGISVGKVEINGNWGGMSPQDIENRWAGALLKAVRSERARASA